MTHDEKLKLAEQIVEELYPPDHRDAFRSYQRGAGISAALAAIEATEARVVEWLENAKGAWTGRYFAMKIQSGAHHKDNSNEQR